MKDFSPFLETKLSNDDKHCTAGINFSSVGAERALCRVCPLADQGDFPLCPNHSPSSSRKPEPGLRPSIQE